MGTQEKEGWRFDWAGQVLGVASPGPARVGAGWAARFSRRPVLFPEKLVFLRAQRPLAALPPPGNSGSRGMS